MRYRANTRLKGAPKHRGSLPFTEAEIQQKAEILAAWGNLPYLPWLRMTPLERLYWLSEAELRLSRLHRSRAA